MFELKFIKRIKKIGKTGGNYQVFEAMTKSNPSPKKIACSNAPNSLPHDTSKTSKSKSDKREPKQQAAIRLDEVAYNHSVV